MTTNPFLLALYLLAAHALGDYSLQPRYMVDTKHLDNFAGWHAMLSHGIIMGACIATVALWTWSTPTQIIAVFLLTAITHTLIDIGKVRHLYGLATDQQLHYIALAMAWVVLQ